MTSPAGPPRFQTVIFDCDSTLSTIEGIDELAAEHRDAVAALTSAAMQGELPLELVYGRRLELIRPSQAAINALGARYIATAVDGARETIEHLHTARVQVRIISGGIRQAILPFAKWLGVAAEHVAAVDVHFDSNGVYAGFDEASPLARSGGKGTIISAWHESTPPPRLMVGDGITDLEARPVVDAFVAFAGVVSRPGVIAEADRVLYDDSLLPLLDFVFPRDTQRP